DLLGQTKRSAEQSMAAFGTSDEAEVYFDRTETPAGPIDGALTIVYQELSPDPRLQDTVEMHNFTIPLHLDIVMPPQPAKVKQEFHISTIQVIIGVVVLLLLVNV